MSISLLALRSRHVLDNQAATVVRLIGETSRQVGDNFGVLTWGTSFLAQAPVVGEHLTLSGGATCTVSAVLPTMFAPSGACAVTNVVGAVNTSDMVTGDLGAGFQVYPALFGSEPVTLTQAYLDGNYDRPQNRVIVFKGDLYCFLLNTVWKLIGSTWTPVYTVGSPAAWADTARKTGLHVAYPNGVPLLCAAYSTNNSTTYGLTSQDGTTWTVTQLSATTAISASGAHRELMFDNDLYFFGGASGYQLTSWAVGSPNYTQIAITEFNHDCYRTALIVYHNTILLLCPDNLTRNGAMKLWALLGGTFQVVVDLIDTGWNTYVDTTAQSQVANDMWIGADGYLYVAAFNTSGHGGLTAYGFTPSYGGYTIHKIGYSGGSFVDVGSGIATTANDNARLWDDHIVRPASFNVASTTGFPNAGVLAIQIQGGGVRCAFYDSKTATSFNLTKAFNPDGSNSSNRSDIGFAVNLLNVACAIFTGLSGIPVLSQSGLVNTSNGSYSNQLSVVTDDVTTPGSPVNYIYYAPSNAVSTQLSVSQFVDSVTPVNVIGSGGYTALALPSSHGGGGERQWSPGQPDIAIIGVTPAPSGETLTYTVYNGALGNVSVAGGTSVVGASTTVSVSQSPLTLPQSSILLTSASGLASSGSVTITTSNGQETVYYTGVSTNTLTGCSGGTGTMTAGSSVVTGTSFTQTLSVGSALTLAGFTSSPLVVQSIADDTHLTLVGSAPTTNASIAAIACRSVSFYWGQTGQAPTNKCTLPTGTATGGASVVNTTGGAGVANKQVDYVTADGVTVNTVKWNAQSDGAQNYAQAQVQPVAF